MPVALPKERFPDRVLAATHRNLLCEGEGGRFRDDSCSRETRSPFVSILAGGHGEYPDNVPVLSGPGYPCDESRRTIRQATRNAII